VGEVYVNFAKAEQYPSAVDNFARSLLPQLTTHPKVGKVNVFCGAPEGGKCLADKMALATQCRYVYPEKKDGGLKWGRHAVEPGEKVVIVEDVSNNFTTTRKLVELIVSSGGKPVAVTCFLNRSLTVRGKWEEEGLPALPVVPLVYKPFGQWRQDDPAVAEDVKLDNVVWDVKNGWARLKQAMEDAAADG